MGKEGLRKAGGILDWVMRWGSVSCLVCIFILIAAGIFVRFVPVSSMGWADEIIEMGFAWMVFLGATVLWKERTHFRVDIIPAWLAGSEAGRKLDIVLNLMNLFFFTVFAHQGWVLTMRTTDPSPILAWPKAIWYSIMPISGLLLAGYTLRDLVLLFRRRPLI
jgi:TRAP-type C4-dicarboxylate transport system permease small subunit